jgi:glycosyltransferase involved in cell wall biosynthesis
LGLRPGRLVFSPRTLMDLYRHDVVLRAMAQLPADVLLLLSARHQDPATRARLDGLIDELDLQDRVTIAESIPHEEMAAVLRLADIVLSIPETDGTPVTILEALAVGRPVVASDVPSVREWLGDLDPGRLVPVGDVAATAAALRHVLETTDAASAAIAVAGRRMVVDAADHDANMRLMEARYAQLAADRPDGPLPVREGLP